MSSLLQAKYTISKTLLGKSGIWCTCQELGGTSSVNKNSQNESAQSAPTPRVLVENELKKVVLGLWIIKFSPLFRSRNTFLVRGIQNPSMILS